MGDTVQPLTAPPCPRTPWEDRDGPGTSRDRPVPRRHLCCWDQGCAASSRWMPPPRFCSTRGTPG